MCGLAGFWNQRRSETTDTLIHQVTQMTQALVHRGPDDSGAWCDAGSGVALGHRRLAILDLTDAGHQPFISACGRYVLVFNGEIYNFAELRKDLESRGRSFRGHSDTEVLVQTIAEWGLPEAVRRCTGMFAFAVWDARDRILSLARDRFGKKPLYYGRQQDTLLFGSELKGLRAHSAFRAEIDRDALAEYLRWGYVPHPQSIYRGIRMLPPASTLSLTSVDGPWPEPVSYWSPPRSSGGAPDVAFPAAVDQLDRLLREAVACRMVADVPVGAFLSGGIDSTLVVALMQQVSSQPVRTFTIGFEDRDYDEAPWAARVARELQTEHTEHYLSAQQARDVIPRLPTIYDEPFGDSSQIPTVLVSALARRSVTVALSGDGGDEVFCGYRRYFEAFRGFGSVPLGTDLFSRAADFVIRRLRRPAWAGSPVRWLLRGVGPGSRGARLAALLEESSPGDRYLRNLSHWPPEPSLVRGGRAAAVPTPDARSLEAWQKWFLEFDRQRYLPDDILTKVDRASMACSLEVRSPLLDSRILEFARRLPHEFLAHGNVGKWILRTVLSRYIPPALFDRPKVGFGIPVGAWLRGPLRDWAESLLAESLLRSDGLLEAAPIRRLWLDHCRGHRDGQYPLWTVLMFQAWLHSR